MKVYILDYGAGNVRSIVNALTKLGHKVNWITSPADFLLADKLIFPGVGNFGNGMAQLHAKGLAEPLKAYLQANRPFLGICVGMQCLFTASDEAEQSQGLGIIDARVERFNLGKPVPHIGWNSCKVISPFVSESRFYFVHSYAVKLAGLSPQAIKWVSALTNYGGEVFVSAIQRGNIFATQFHPEKSGKAGLELIESFLAAKNMELDGDNTTLPRNVDINVEDDLAKRIIACLDVRSNDQGDLVVTKGDQYDVREKSGESHVRNLGKPVELAKKYYVSGADEITFLNITSFRDSPLKDLPMLEVLRQTSESVFVPLTIGGGIRDITDATGKVVTPALEVVGEYFRSGADKVSIGSDAVYSTEKYLKGIREACSISEISRVYGVQAVVISVDPKRVYVSNPQDCNHEVLKTDRVGPKGECYCWYQCTVKGGRESRDIDIRQLITTSIILGAGEILLNCIDNDGQNSGFDLELVRYVKSFCTIPVIASSGAGKVEHFSDVFETGVEAALAAGIFHRGEVEVGDVKEFVGKMGYKIRI